MTLHVRKLLVLGSKMIKEIKNKIGEVIRRVASEAIRAEINSDSKNIKRSLQRHAAKTTAEYVNDYLPFILGSYLKRETIRLGVKGN